MTTRYLPAPAPYTGEQRCPTCSGEKITGSRYHFAPTVTGHPGTRPVLLLVDEFCPTCLGCGRAVHDGCDPAEHAESDDLDDDLDDDGPVCPSCHGPGWVAVLGFPSSGDRVHHLRVPCGCSEALLIEAGGAGG